MGGEGNSRCARLDEGKKMTKVILFIFMTIVCWNVHAGGDVVADSLVNGDQEILINWKRGQIEGDGVGIAWNVHGCTIDSGFVCLVIEGFGVELAYPADISMTPSWSFDGRNYRLAMVKEGEMLIVSRFSSQLMSQDGGPDRNRINLIKIKNNKLLEYVSYEDTDDFKELIRWKSLREDGVDLLQRPNKSKVHYIDSLLVKKCTGREQYNCLKR